MRCMARGGPLPNQAHLDIRAGEGKSRLGEQVVVLLQVAIDLDPVLLKRHISVQYGHAANLLHPADIRMYVVIYNAGVCSRALLEQ